MSLKRAITTFFKDPEPVGAIDHVEPGMNIVDGIAKIDTPLRSPVKGQNCIGYHYQSYLVISSPRNPQPQIQKLRDEEVYSPFELQMEGGTLVVQPDRRAKFTREDHLDLKNRYGNTFQGVEDLILPGAKVRVKGTVKVVDGKPAMKMSLITVLEKQVAAKGVVGDRKKRKKGGN